MDEHKRIVYVDMDGVIADWEGGVTKVTGIENVGNSHKYDDIIWPKIDTYGKVKFFAELDWMPGGKALWAFVTENFLHVKILSCAGGGPRNLDDRTAKGKIEWLRHNIPSFPIDNVILVNNKHAKQRYSKPGDIIIDDTPIIIQEWIAKGGIGILNVSSLDTIEELKKYIWTS
jgi:5'(3')-deoxyribonucleotidase